MSPAAGCAGFASLYWHAWVTRMPPGYTQSTRVALLIYVLPRCPAGKGWLDVAERLAASGADPHIKNGKGWLAIQVRGE